MWLCLHRSSGIHHFGVALQAYANRLKLPLSILFWHPVFQEQIKRGMYGSATEPRVQPPNMLDGPCCLAVQLGHVAGKLVFSPFALLLLGLLGSLASSSHYFSQNPLPSTLLELIFFCLPQTPDDFEATLQDRPCYSNYATSLSLVYLEFADRFFRVSVVRTSVPASVFPRGWRTSVVAIRRIYHAISKILVFFPSRISMSPYVSARLIRNTPVCFVICKLRHLLFVSPHRITCSVPRIISWHQWSIKHQAKSVVCSARQVSGSPWHFSRRQIWSPHQLHLNVLVLFLVLIPVGVGVESLPCSTQSLMGSG